MILTPLPQGIYYKVRPHIAEFMLLSLLFKLFLSFWGFVFKIQGMIISN